MSPNIGNLLNGVLTPNLLKNPFSSCLLINLDFFLLHIAHFDNIIILPLLVRETCGFIFSERFLYFKQYDSILYLCIAHKIIQNYIVTFKNHVEKTN